MIDQETKDKWIAALRSGNYKQGKTQLRRDDETGSEFCCLGVLCEVMGKETCTSYGLGTEAYLFSWPDGAPRKFTVSLPFDVIDETTQYSLMEFNDDCAWSFSMIADWIEENIKP
jgi:hypothetical protein